MRFCRNRTGPDDVSRTARATANRIGIRMGMIDKTQAQSKMRLAPERDQELRGFPIKKTSESELDLDRGSGRNLGKVSPAPEMLRCASGCIFVESGLLETYDSVITMNPPQHN